MLLVDRIFHDLEPQNASIRDFNVVRKSRSVDFEGSKLVKSSVGLSNLLLAN